MKIQLTPQESEQFFHDSLCNGLNEFCMYDIEIDFDRDEYKKSKQNTVSEYDTVCFEEVLMQMLRDGYKIKAIDHNEDEVYEIGLKEVHERVQNSSPNHLLDMINEDGDAITADVILQQVFLNEHRYA